MNKLALVPDVPGLEPELQKKLRELLSHTRAKNTLRTYQSTWNKWCFWASSKGLPVFPATAQDLVTYMMDIADQGATKSTLAMFLTVQRIGHKGRIDDPTKNLIVQETWTALRRKDKRPVKKPDTISLSELELLCNAVLQNVTTPFRGYRDRALMALGWAGALRAGELVALTWSDIRFSQEGLELFIRTSKTDPEAKGSIIGLPYYSNQYRQICPVRALQQIKPRADSFGFIFRRIKAEGQEKQLSTKAVTRIIQRAAALAGLPGQYSAHSLRHGLASWAASQGATDRQIMRHGRWRSRHVLDGYVQRGTIWTDNLLKNLLGDEHD